MVRNRMRLRGITPPLAAGLALAGMVGPLQTAHAQSFDANTDFLTFNAGSSPWKTGFETTLGAPLTLYDVFVNGSPFQDYHSSVVFNSGAPNFAKNISGGTVNGTPPGAIELHPGPNNEYSAIRFTVPTTGTYTINSQFFAGDTGDTDGTILLNNNTVTPLFFANTTTTNPSYSSSVPLNSGDTLDFLVGSKGSFFSDTTPLTVNIQAAATPEPGSLAVLGGIGASASLLALRRRRSRQA